jgi:D-sedoheptulose 7-phosphate isomerase
MIDMKKVILKARKNKKKVIFAGNGTSSLTATRGAMGLITQLGIECTAITDPSFITAAANDFGYEDVFTRYVNLFAHKGDVVVLISASGKSKNICDVSVVAHQKGCTVITFSGFNINNPLKKSGDINFWTSCNEYSKVESIHNVWMGMICDFILKDEKHKVGIHGIEF